MQQIWFINGPNLNLLGKREPALYGRVSFEVYFEKLVSKYAAQVELCYFQSNHEGALIDKLHLLGFDPKILGIVINPGAYTHTSLAIADALSAIETPCIEVHISHIYQREAIRQKSLTASACKAILAGFGLKGYELALISLLDGQLL